MVHAVVFDLFGVIALHQSEGSKRRLEQIAGVDPAAFWEAYWALRKPYDAGQKTLDYWAAVGERLATTFDAATTAALIEADLDSWMRVDERMVTLLQELAAEGCTLGLLSNIVEDFVPVLEAKHGSWLSLFRARTYSSYIGIAKPDHASYRMAAERLGVAPSDCIFFDDNAINVHAARETGMRAEVFTSPEQVREILQSARAAAGADGETPRQ